MEGIMGTILTDLVLPLVTLLLTTFAIPALVGFMRKNKIEVREREVALLQSMAKSSVRLAEVKIHGGGKVKFAAALDELVADATGAGISLAKQNISKYVEAAHSEVFGEK